MKLNENVIIKYLIAMSEKRPRHMRWLRKATVKK